MTADVTTLIVTKDTKNKSVEMKKYMAEIHQASHFSLQGDFINTKVLVKHQDSRVLNLVNLCPSKQIKRIQTYQKQCETGPV